MSEMEKMVEMAVDRKNNPEEGSYTSYLFNKGLEKILKKVGEESTEVIIAAMGENKEDLVNEINDLLYHLAVLMAEKDVSWAEVEECMKERTKTTHNLKPERKEITEY